jgi:hypothetical protein
MKIYIPKFCGFKSESGTGGNAKEFLLPFQIRMWDSKDIYRLNSLDFRSGGRAGGDFNFL